MSLPRRGGPRQTQVLYQPVDNRSEDRHNLPHGREPLRRPDVTTLALQYFRSAPRYVGARTLGSKAPGLIAGPLAPLRLASVKDPEPPAGRSGWARVRPLLSGICGSDLSTLAGRSSFYFSPLVSLPFVPGHEVVGELLEDCEDLAAGTRVVLSSVLSCAARGEDPMFGNCEAGLTGRCD